MRNKGNLINYLGYLFGILSLIIIILSLSCIIRDRPVSRIRKFPFRMWAPIDWEETLRKPSTGWTRIEGEEIIGEPYKNLEVKNISGDIDITGWKEDYFLIKYVKSGPAKEWVEELRVQVNTTENVISVKRLPELKSLIQRGSVSFDIFIPDTVKTISANSVSGHIILNQMPAGITQTLKTVSGRIKTDNSGNLQVSSVSGSTSFQFSGSTLNVSTISGSIRGEMSDLKSGGSLELSSVSGSIHINADETLNSDISLKSVSGSISCDFPVTISVKKRTLLEGKIGEGFIPMNIKTTSGSIKIRKS